MTLVDRIVSKDVLSRVGPWLAGNRRLVAIGGGAVAATALAMALIWSGGPDYSVLFAGLSGAEGGRALAELQKLNVPYRIAEGGRVILVPSAEVGQARLQLAAHGIPKQGGDEWGLLDNEALGVSPFVEQVHYVRGLEAALGQTIGGIDGVLSAKVTLALPKNTEFLADEPKPSASVMVLLRPGVALGRAQVRGIVGLVTSSVPGLSAAGVTVVDQSGTVLSRDDKDGLADIPDQIALVRQINARYERRIVDLLAPVVGRENVRVSVDADVDFTQSKQNMVHYGTSHVLSQDKTVKGVNAETEPTGVPGALSNRPPGTPVAPFDAQNAGNQNGDDKTAGTPTDAHTTTNYDLDTTTESVQAPPWRVRAVTVSVLLNNPTGSPIPAERIQSLKRLANSAVGVGDMRDVTVVDLPFETGPDTAILALPWWQQPWARLAAQNALLAAAGLLALFGGLIPMLGRLRPRYRLAVAGAGADPVPTRSASTHARPGVLRAERTPDEGAERPSGAGPNIDMSAVIDDAFNVDIDTVRMIVANDPGRTAQVVKEWISRGTTIKQSG